MAVTDWDIYKSNAGATVNLDILTPMEGAASVVLNVATPLGEPSREHIVLVPSDAGGLPHGKLAGRLRSIIRVEDFTGANGNRSYGFTFMMNQDDVSGVTGECYMARLHLTQNPPSRDLSILKCTQGFNVVAVNDTAPGTSVIATTVPAFLTSLLPGDTIPFEIEWIADSVQLNGVQMKVRHGLIGDLDFINLDASSPVITYLDTSSPFLTTVAEGIAIRHGGQAVFDTTTLYELT